MVIVKVYVKTRDRKRNKELKQKMHTGYSKLHNCNAGFITRIFRVAGRNAYRDVLSDLSKLQLLKQSWLYNDTRTQKKKIIKPVINEAIDAFLPEQLPVLMLIVVISPAEDHQAFRLGFCNAVHVA